MKGYAFHINLGIFGHIYRMSDNRLTNAVVAGMLRTNGKNKHEFPAQCDCSITDAYPLAARPQTVAQPSTYNPQYKWGK